MSMLKVLEDKRIVSFELGETCHTVSVREECDGYFDLVLTKANMGALIEELKAIHARML